MSAGFAALPPELQRAAQAAGFDEATPIQQLAIARLLAGGDVLMLAETGSGKTAAFALPVLAQCLQGSRGTPHAAQGPRALVLAPSRELAQQSAQLLRDLVQGLSARLKIGLAFGGVSINPQLMALRGGCDVMVATPGRLLDLIEHNGLQLGSVQTVVLDEADRLLDAGFQQEWQRIEALLPAKGQRQMVLVSATCPPKLNQLLADALHEPERIELNTTPPDILQRVIQVDAAQRTPLLRHLLATEGWQRVLVFVATRHAAEHVANKLHAPGVPCASLHGELSQGTRQEVLAALKSGAVRVLVSTDVAARGLHIAQLDAVVNHELPRAAAEYIHRIGRTGRMGQRGVAVSLVCADSATNAEAHMRLIEKRQGQRVPREQVAGFEPKAVATEQAATGGIKGRRPSKKDKLRAAGLRPLPSQLGD